MGKRLANLEWSCCQTPRWGHMVPATSGMARPLLAPTTAASQLQPSIRIGNADEILQWESPETMVGRACRSATEALGNFLAVLYIYIYIFPPAAPHHPRAFFRPFALSQHIYTAVFEMVVGFFLAPYVKNVLLRWDCQIVRNKQTNEQMGAEAAIFAFSISCFSFFF